MNFSRKTHILRAVALGAAVVTTVGAAPAAHAFIVSHPGCFSTAPRWNAAKGAIVSGISHGPINAVLTAVGETRTHTMISHGDWATHSTSLSPSTRGGTVPSSVMPLEPVELAQGTPGLSQIPMGGAFAYWTSAQQVFTQVIPPRPIIQIFCGDGCKAQKVADWLWFDVPFRQVSTAASHFEDTPDSYYYQLGFNRADGSFDHLPYGFFQYRMGVDKIHGADIDSPDDRGIVCSQAPAWAYSHWINTPDRAAVVPGTESMDGHQYTHDETMAAIDGLWNSIFSECRGGATGFWSLLGEVITAAIGINKTAICTAAAYQVLNCFLMGEEPDGSGCKSPSSAPRSNYRKNRGIRGANSLSPDTLMGLSGRPRTGNTVGPWANLNEVALQFNGGGSNYGCYY